MKKIHLYFEQRVLHLVHDFKLGDTLTLLGKEQAVKTAQLLLAGSTAGEEEA